MTEAPRATTASAGSTLLAAIVLCALTGYALGTVIGVAALGAVVGGFGGIGVGFTVVYRRFKNL